MMSNQEWRDLVAREFNVSNTVAKNMVHAMFEVYNKDKQRQEIEEVIRRTNQNQNTHWTDLVVQMATSNTRA